MFDGFLALDYGNVTKKITSFISGQVNSKKKNGVVIGLRGHRLIGLRHFGMQSAWKQRDNWFEYAGKRCDVQNRSSKCSFPGKKTQN
jgi:hypothetical protein